MQELTQTERREAIRRALEGDQLARSPKLRQLLRYICDDEREGHPEELTEREIGVAVFGRPEHYDSSADNIVRVQARNLRKRLAAYYAARGAGDPVRIRIPKGHYLPVFERVLKSPASPLKQHEQAEKRGLLVAAGAFALAAAGFIAGLSVAHPAAPEGTAGQPVSFQAAQLYGPWSQVLKPGEPTMLVVSDNTFSMSQRLLGRSLSLDDYLAGGVEFQYRARAVVPEKLRRTRKEFDLIAWREQTSFTSLAKAVEISSLAGPLAGQIEIRYPRDLHARDLTGKNLILLGSKRTLPWIELFEPKLNFHYGYDEAMGAPYFENRAPLAGERNVYQRGGSDGTSSVTYSHVALLPNLDSEGRVLILSGAGDSAQAALTNHLLHASEARRILLEIGVDPETPSSFEAILRSSRIHGAGNMAEVVAARVYGSTGKIRLTRAR